ERRACVKRIGTGLGGLRGKPPATKPRAIWPRRFTSGRPGMSDQGPGVLLQRGLREHVAKLRAAADARPADGDDGLELGAARAHEKEVALPGPERGTPRPESLLGDALPLQLDDAEGFHPRDEGEL